MRGGERGRHAGSAGADDEHVAGHPVDDRQGGFMAQNCNRFYCCGEGSAALEAPPPRKGSRDDPDSRDRRAGQHRHRPDVQAAAQRPDRAALDDRRRPRQPRAGPGARARPRGQPRGRGLAAQAGRAARPDLRGDQRLRAPPVRPALRRGRHPRGRPDARRRRPGRDPGGQLRRARGRRRTST